MAKAAATPEPTPVYEQGRDAFEAGLPSDVNPYQTPNGDTENAVQWELGWEFAAAQTAPVPELV